MFVDMDMDNRDPNDLNEHLKIQWEDLIGEPEGNSRSIDCTWRCSRGCFQCTNRCCYILLTTLISPCYAFCLGLNYACLAFQMIWSWGPCLKQMEIFCGFYNRALRICLDGACGPFINLVQRCFCCSRSKDEIV